MTDEEVDDGRRGFLKGLTGGAALAAMPLAGREAFLRVFDTHYKEMSEGEKERLIERLERELEEEYGKETDVATTDAEEGVYFGYALNIRKCIGCRRCVYACVQENNQSRGNPDDPTDSQIQWIRVLELPELHLEPGHEEQGIGTEYGDVLSGIMLEESEHFYEPGMVPEDGKFYMPVQCQQCEDPPCVTACPTSATWKEPDGIVTIDYDWCIGCRFCMAACPYYARRFNWGEPHLSAEEFNPDTHYLGNRPRSKGVVEKCTYCIQRCREGRYPACVEVCPVGARKFGNLLDPESEVRKIIEGKRVFRLKEDLGTEPKFFYFID